MHPEPSLGAETGPDSPGTAMFCAFYCNMVCTLWSWLVVKT